MLPMALPWRTEQQVIRINEGFILNILSGPYSRKAIPDISKLRMHVSLADLLFLIKYLLIKAELIMKKVLSIAKK